MSQPEYAPEAKVTEVAMHLATTAIFARLSSLELTRIAQHCVVRNLPRATELFRAGQSCEAFHILLTGQVKLYLLSANGQEKVVEIFGPGQSFAEAFMFLDEPYIVHAQTLTPTKLITVSKDGVCAEIKRDPTFAMHMLSGVARRLRHLLKDVEGYALQSGVQRLIGYLLRDLPLDQPASPTDWQVQLPASKATIASRLSLTSEYFSRVLHELESRGLIRVERRIIKIPDVRKLMDCSIQASS